jgi:hypothetical protein
LIAQRAEKPNARHDLASSERSDTRNVLQNRHRPAWYSFMKSDVWTTSLRAIYDKAITLYRNGQRGDRTYFSSEETEFLASVGLRPINVYDYVEDFVSAGEPDWETYLLIVAVRRHFFIFEQKWAGSVAEIRPDELPPKRATLAGIPWLPRIIKKATCFLEGALCHDIMYGCGGDRHFLREHRLHPADFLQAVWLAKGDQEKIINFMQVWEKARLETK